MTKTPYSKGQRNFQFGPIVPKRALPTLAFSLFLTGCQLVSTSSTSSTLSSEKKASNPVVEKVEAQKPVKVVPVKAPVVVDNLWVRIQSGLAMDLNQNNSRIQAELELSLIHI